MEEMKSSLQVFSRKLTKLGAKYKNIVVLNADTTMLMMIKQFADVFPERHFNFGLSDQNLVGVAAGMTIRGKLPIICIPAMRVGKIWEQLRNLICYQNLNVKIVSCFAGVGVGYGGGMRQMFEDVAIMRNLPHMKVVTPMDAIEAEDICLKMVNDFGPTYLRLSEREYPWDAKAKMSFQFGKSSVIRGGKDVVVFSSGDMVMEMLEVAKILDDKHGVAVSVVNLSSIKPIHEKLIIQQAMKARKIVTVEEHSVIGGLGSAVVEILSKHGFSSSVRMIGMEDCFGKSAGREELMMEYGLDRNSLIDKVLATVR